MSEEIEVLQARLADYLHRADRGSIAVSKFLTPAEQKKTEKLARESGIANRCLFWGGYAGAERKRLLVLPEYYASVEEFLPGEGENPAQTLPDPDGDCVGCIRITGSKFRNLSHRDYLGSVLALGLERDSVGDIAVQGDCEAVLFCSRALVPFLLENLKSVASDKVKCREFIPDETFTDGRVYQPVNDTVASPRLDCVVAALTNLSREASQQLIRTGNAELDYESEQRCDRMLEPPCVLSLRGYGRFYLDSFDGETKKGRLRMKARSMKR